MITCTVAWSTIMIMTMIVIMITDHWSWWWSWSRSWSLWQRSKSRISFTASEIAQIIHTTINLVRDISVTFAVNYITEDRGPLSWGNLYRCATARKSNLSKTFSLTADQLQLVYCKELLRHTNRRHENNNVWTKLQKLHAEEQGPSHTLQKPAPFLPATFSFRVRLEWKFLVPKINMSKNIR